MGYEYVLHIFSIGQKFVNQILLALFTRDTIVEGSRIVHNSANLKL